ncbi:MAG: methylated-DNA--[protein]-cysteine S-methyltransferase [Anaerolineae bacterium]|nr:methylated-DNA--[protein]-cysteine S-methyltransferase [Anaerolineae bacterium]
MNAKGSSPIWIGTGEQERLGPIWVALSSAGLVAVLMKGTEAALRRHLAPAEAVINQERTVEAISQIVAYLNGERREFDLPIDWSVLASFHSRVLRIVHAIPYGQTRTYGEIANELGMTNGARAVGRANATNPIPLVIPCHRVVGSDGRLHGYGGPGGVTTKAWLLQLEGSRLL